MRLLCNSFVMRSQIYAFTHEVNKVAACCVFRNEVEAGHDA